MNNAYLFEGLAAGPRAIETLMKRIPEAAIDLPTHPGRFSPREVIAHLADWEPRLLDRIRTAVEQPGGLVEVWDEGELAIANRYGELDWQAELDRFKSLRQDTTAYLKSMRPADFDLLYVHPERGPMKAEDQAGFFLGHDLYHIEQLGSVAR